jgi:hypothetical protein
MAVDCAPLPSSMRLSATGRWPTGSTCRPASIRMPIRCRRSTRGAGNACRRTTTVWTRLLPRTMAASGCSPCPARSSDPASAGALRAPGSGLHDADLRRTSPGLATRRPRVRRLENVALPRALAVATPMIVLCNPNNPTGRRLPAAELLAAARQLQRRGGWLVVDEAFATPSPRTAWPLWPVAPRRPI